MDLQRTLLIGAVAVVGVLTLQQWNQDYNQPTRPTGEVVTSMSNVSIAQSGSDMPTLTSDAGEVTLDGNTQPSAQLVSVKTDTLNVQIDPAGGDIIGLSLPQFPAWLPEEDEEVSPFELMVQNPDCVSGDVTCVYTAQSALVRADGPQANNLRPLYNIKQSSYTLEDGNNTIVVDLIRSTDELNLTKSFTFTRGSYDVRMDYVIENKSDTVWADRFYAQLKRDSSEDPSTVNSSAPMRTFIGGVVRVGDKPYVKVDFKDFAGKSRIQETVEGGYAGIQQLYFVSAWVPAQDQRHTFYTSQSRDGQYNFIGFIDNIEILPGQTLTAGADLYAGPKDQKSMNALADGLQLTMDFGWLWFLAQPLFTLLKFIQSMVGNWGWSIILLTVCVKAIFYPLNATSFRSMAKMRKLGPKMQALKEKHGDDRQKLSQEMMEMYKKEKVNPMGGCLPILVQMPVFIALYWVLQESVELRQAPWLGWIHDLSQMDPYFILPLIMGGSMFAQQLLNPIPPDPVQAKVMKMMPVIFTVFFLWFPAGLVLYWVTNNTLSIIQQYMITRKIEREGSPARSS